MICFLQGIVSEVGSDWLSLNVQGVGYKALCSTRTLAAAKKDEALHLIIHMHVREQEITLFGFTTSAERDLFNLLTTVNGVGPKAGLSILSTLSPSEISEAVTLQNGKMIARANGVGPKIGERVVRELKSKIGALETLPAAANGGSVTPISSTAQDVLSALTNLGYKPERAQKALSETAEAMPEASFDVLLKSTLKSLQ